MNGSKPMDDDYSVNVIQAGDDVSEILKEACKSTNSQFSYLQKLHALKGNKMKLDYPLIQHVDANLESQTDGVGTKVRIYMRQFNLMYEAFRAEKMRVKEHMMNTSALEDWDGISEPPGAYIKKLQQEFQETANELMYRMILDLVAMIVDDFRDGHVATSLTDIIDVNHIKIDKNNPDKEQGIVWANAMKYAFEKVIQETEIAIVAGETAVLNKGDNEVDQSHIAKTTLSRAGEVERLLQQGLHTISISRDFRDQLLALLNPKGESTLTELRDFHTIVEGRMEMNIGGSANGLINGERLVEMQPGDLVVAFFEKRTDTGVISPRANGMSDIRELKTLFGDNWTNRTLADFFAHPDISQKDGAEALEQKFKNQGLTMDMKLWDVLTGRTTVFNPLISRKLLGGLDSDTPNLQISGLAHITGNPPRKLAELIGKRNLSVYINYTNIDCPQAIEMRSLMAGYTFERGLGRFNMGIPYIATFRPFQIDTLMRELRGTNYRIRVVGEVTEPQEGEEPTVTIYHGQETLTYSIPDLLMKD